MRINEFTKLFEYQNLYPQDKSVTIEKSNSDGRVISRYHPRAFTPQEGELHLLYYNENEFRLTFICPCGCGKELSIHGNIGVEKQHWSLIKNADGTITTTPSILHINDCKSHFFITNNKVNWA